MFLPLISLLHLSLSLSLSLSPPVIVCYTPPSSSFCDCTSSLQWHVYTNYLNRPLFCQPCCAAQLLISPLSVQHAALYYFFFLCLRCVLSIHWLENWSQRECTACLMQPMCVRDSLTSINAHSRC